MTSGMIRTVANACFAIVVAITLIWLLQTLGLVSLIDDPLIGIVAFGLVGLLLASLARKGARPPG